MEILQTTERNLLSVASTCLRCSQYQNLNSEIMCKQVLVTGASGFIASRLVSDLIASGENVSCFLRDPKKVTPKMEKHCQLCIGDINDETAVRNAVSNAKLIYHVAGITRSLYPNQMMEVNCELCQN